MHHIDISTSGGWWLKAECHEPYEYYREAAFGKEYRLHKAVWALAADENIEGFKKEFCINHITHLSLDSCGQHQFTVTNDEFTDKLGHH